MARILRFCIGAVFWLVSAVQCGSMNIHVVHLQHFEREPVPLDLDVYRLFSKNPIPVPVNY